MRKWFPLLVIAGCGGGGGVDDESTGAPTTVPSTPSDPTMVATTGPGADTTADVPTSDATQAPTTDTSTGPPPATSTTSTTGPAGCGACNEPNQQCIADECVTGCQGQDPSPCGPGEVCDVISGECSPQDAACVLAGPTTACGDQQCGPGTVCDDMGACLPVAPCALATCDSGGHCWGGGCQCERGVTCTDPPTAVLNDVFGLDIAGLDFSDDCTAWAVTLSVVKEYVRRLDPAGVLASWPADGDYDLGEVRVLRHLTVPQLTLPPGGIVTAPADPTHVEGYGEVAVTYICCPSCGDCAGNPNARGVARLVEDDPNMPLPIVIFAEPTQGTGPFGQMHLDGGPQGLTWGNDRVLYVGNTKENGQFDTADLVAATVDPVVLFPERVTASAAISPVHLLVALDTGELHRLNTATQQTVLVVDLMAGVTSLSHDAFNGDVYASLADLSVVRVRPFTGEVEDFAVMPMIGRVAVSPSGNLWFTPVKYLTMGQGTLAPWPLPSTL